MKNLKIFYIFILFTLSSCNIVSDYDGNSKCYVQLNENYQTIEQFNKKLLNLGRNKNFNTIILGERKKYIRFIIFNGNCKFLHTNFKKGSIIFNVKSQNFIDSQIIIRRQVAIRSAATIREIDYGNLNPFIGSDDSCSIRRRIDDFSQDPFDFSTILRENYGFPISIGLRYRENAFFLISTNCDYWNPIISDFISQSRMGR